MDQNGLEWIWWIIIFQWSWGSDKRSVWVFRNSLQIPYEMGSRPRSYESSFPSIEWIALGLIQLMGGETNPSCIALKIPKVNHWTTRYWDFIVSVEALSLWTRHITEGFYLGRRKVRRSQPVQDAKYDPRIIWLVLWINLDCYPVVRRELRS